jgi:hypothetical protein
MRTWIAADPLRALLAAIALLTALTGATQMFAPGAVLRPLGAELTSTTRHLFATVGMFMVIVGGMLATTLLSHQPTPVVVVWSALQKLGAFLAVLLGVLADVFGSVALGVAFFDLITALLLGLYWHRLRRGGVPAGTPPEVPL